MSKLALSLATITCICLTTSGGHAQPAATVSRPTVMIVVEPNRTRVDGRQLRSAVTRALPVIAIPVSFPNATESSAWIAISAAEDGKVAMRVRRTDGRGASRVERAPAQHVLEWLVAGVGWLLEASTAPAGHEHPQMASRSDLDQDIGHHTGEPAAARTPMTNIEDLDRDLARNALTQPGGAEALTAPTP